MRGMDLDHANAKAQDVLNIGHDVGGMPWMQAATGDQALGIVLGVIGDELVDRGCKADHFRRNVIDQGSAVNAATVQISEESLGRAAIFDNLIEIGALALHQFKRVRLEQVNGPDVDMAVGDQGQLMGSSYWLLAITDSFARSQ